MKFVCDRCGKKYATADDPSPGKVYKLKCKACGHLIVVRSQAGTSTTIPVVTSTEHAIQAGGILTAPEIELDIEPPRPPAAPSSDSPHLLDTGRMALEGDPTPVDDDAVLDALPPLPLEVATAVDAAGTPAPAPVEPPLAHQAGGAHGADAHPTSPGGAAPGEAPRYVDLFGDGITGEPRKLEPAVPPAHLEVGGSAPLAGAGGGTRLPDAKRPMPARPPPATKRGSPGLLIGAGVAVIVLITAVALIKGGRKGEGAAVPPSTIVAPAPAPEPVQAEATPPAPPTRSEPEPAPEPPPKAAEAAPPAPKVVERPVAPPPAPPKPVVERRPEPPRPRVVERRPEPPKAAPPPEPKPAPPPPPPEPKPEPKAEPPKVVAQAPPEPKPEQRVETREVQLPDAEQALTPDVVQKVINANKKAFAGCIASAGDSVKLDGRRVVLKLTVNSSGAVTYPTLDDVTLNSTEMGQCLKSAARLMIFPKFKGDPFHVEVPLTLSN